MAATRTRDVIDGLIAEAIADLNTFVGSPPRSLSTLYAAAHPYGVDISSAMSADYPTEYLQFRRGVRGDPPLGFSVMLDPVRMTQESYLVPGPIQRRFHGVTAICIWRDTAALKLTDTPEALGDFMSEITQALAALWDRTALAPYGTWTLSTGESVSGQFVTAIDDAAEEDEIRNTYCHTTEIQFACYSIH